MKYIFLYTIIFLLSGCFEMFPKDEKLIGSCKFSNNAIVELHYIGMGATSKNIIRVQKKNEGSNILVKVIEGFNDTYKVEMKPLDDTLLKITFTDTINFKSQSRDFIVNLNERINELK